MKKRQECREKNLKFIDATIEKMYDNFTNIPKIFFFFFRCENGIMLRDVSRACCVAEARAAWCGVVRRGAARWGVSRARLYIKWCSRFTSQIESRAIGRFSISFNNGLCYTSPTSSGPLFLFSSSHHPSYFRSARSRISLQERIHRASRCWGFIRTVWYP